MRQYTIELDDAPGQLYEDMAQAAGQPVEEGMAYMLFKVIDIIERKMLEEEGEEQPNRNG